ncbi:integral membrane sensor signal transduction histidine kinase [Gloeothece citriformis PCC 7424]|uniref:histidine kinase n=1 Tax=Gloeothece citriformis (strain PCC 7424) TaxID=65393 RepID=B7K724_GLOC7|nr:two-component system sensor histidine kinase RppB [Gloeothece citriformis]ACK69592.1 integral membrane sensor signal transduction histidine kinase [Gloeothece citriformis PCC 7424]
MKQNQLFNRTRWRLAFWYAGVMGIIFSVSGYGLYQAIAHAHWMTLDRELESVAGILHDSLESKLKTSGELEPNLQELLPNLCKVGSSCQENHYFSSPRYTSSAIYRGNYYVRLYNKTGQLLAIAGTYPTGFSSTFNRQEWQTLEDNQGISYHQISRLLHTKNGQDWGYIQVGRSFKDFEHYLANVRWVLKLGLPTTLIVVAVSSWWLAGLAMQPVYQSYQQMQQFTADAAHELRTPLAAIRATVESALMMPILSEKESRDTLKTINRQTVRLSNLVADLLMLCRLDWQLMIKSQGIIKNEVICLNDLVSDIVEELASLAISSQINLSHEIRADHPLEIKGNEDQLYRLVSNLVVNGIQYTLAGGQVKLILEQSKNYALIQVQDTGIGINLQEQKHIFDRFYRVNKSRCRDQGGSGLGLSIVRAIALVHQGTISVQTELGKGSIFSVRFPLNVKG